jgi:hypothetical protein
VRRCIAYLYKKIQRRRSTGSRLDHKGKERYKEEKNMIHKRREEGKPEQRGGE